MSSELCPKCGALYDGSVNGAGWATCDACGHLWMAAGAAKDETADLKSTQAATDDPGFDLRSAVLDSRQLVAEDSSAPTGEFRERQPTILERHDSDYMPVSYHDDPDQALTGRSVRPEADERLSPNGSQIALSLFDEIEKEIVSEKQRKGSQAQPTVAITCPVCSTDFDAPQGLQEATCPRCDSVVDISTTRMHRRDPGSGRRSNDPLINATVSGYHIDRKIGEGGMGSVYHARQLSLDRSVAIKVLPPDLKHDKKFLMRFEQEAKSLARINHPNILHIYDFGEDNRNGIYYMVMEFVDGLDLAEILRQRRRVPVLEVLDMIRQSSLGLEQAAEKGVVHRDIKPDNLMVTSDGVWKVSDFGLAKNIEASTQMTRAGIRVGTPAFMSPEQCDGHSLDFRSDIYSLGITAFVGITGRLPFDGESPFAIMLKHKTEPPPLVSKFVPDADPRVEALIVRMTAKSPDDRYSTLRELIDHVEQVMNALADGAYSPREESGKHPLLKDDAADLRVVDAPARDLPPVAGDLVDAPDLRNKTMKPFATPEEMNRPPSADVVLPPGGVSSPELPARGVDSDVNVVADVPPMPDLPGGLRLTEMGSRDDIVVPPIPGNAPPPAAPVAAAPVHAEVALPPGAQPLSLQPQAPAPASHSQGAPIPPAAAGPTADASRAGRRSATSDRLGVSNESASSSARMPLAEADESRRIAREERVTERNRKRRKEVAELEREGDELAGKGRVAQARDKWRQAAQRCLDYDRRDGILRKIERAGGELNRRRRSRLWLGVPFVIGLLVVGVYFGVPLIHNSIATNAFAQIQKISDSDQQRTQLDAFIEQQESIASWYVMAFPEYEIKAVIEARELVARMKSAKSADVENRQGADRLGRLSQRIDAGKTSFDKLAEEIEELETALPNELQPELAAEAQRVEDQRAEVLRQLAAVDAALGEGRVSAALELAQSLRADPRLGSLAMRLPIPVQVRFAELEHGIPPETRLLVDGVALPSLDTPAYRRGDRVVTLEVAAPGYDRFIHDIEPGTEPITDLEVVLQKGLSWRSPVGLHADDAKWARILSAEEGHAWVFGARGLVHLKLEDGSIVNHIEVGEAAWLDDWVTQFPEGDIFVKDRSGRVFNVVSGDIGLNRLLIDCGGPIQAYVPFKRGERWLHAVVIQTGEGYLFSALDGSLRLWENRDLVCEQQALIHDNGTNLVLVDDLSVKGFDDDGKVKVPRTFSGIREGIVARFAGLNQIVIPMMEQLRLVNVARPVDWVAGQDIALAAPVVVGLVQHGHACMAVLADATVLVAQCEPGRLTKAWQQQIPSASGAIRCATMSHDYVVVGDTGGTLTVFRRATGDLHQVLDHGSAVLSVYVAGSRLLVYGEDGAVVSYGLRQ